MSGSADIPGQCDVLVVTALKDEFEAFVALEDDFDPWKETTDPNGYPLKFRRFKAQQGGAFLVVATWTAMGPVKAASWLGKLTAQLSPKCLAMSGICAGWRKKTSQGDVIVAEKVYQYDAGKLVAGENGAQLLQDIETFKLSPQWIRWIKDHQTSWKPSNLDSRPISLRLQEDWILTSLLNSHDGNGRMLPGLERRRICPDFPAVRLRLERAKLLELGRLELTLAGKARAERILQDFGTELQPDRDFKVHTGSMATGNAVIEDRSIFPTLEKGGIRSVLGLEMEAVVVGITSEVMGIPHWLVVKSVQDFADDDKDDRYRSFACQASAEYLLYCLKHLTPASGANSTPNCDSSSTGFRSLSSFKSLLIQQAPRYFVPEFQWSPELMESCRNEIITGRFILIEALGGAGKTRLAVELGESLSDFNFQYLSLEDQPGDSKAIYQHVKHDIVVIDNAHRRTDWEKLQKFMLSDTSCRFILLTRPGYEHLFISMLRPLGGPIKKLSLSAQPVQVLTKIIIDLNSENSPASAQSIAGSARGNPGIAVILASLEHPTTQSKIDPTHLDALYSIAESILAIVESKLEDIRQIRCCKLVLALIACGRRLALIEINTSGEIVEAAKDLADFGVIRFQDGFYSFSSDILSDAMFRRLFCHPSESNSRYMECFEVHAKNITEVYGRHDHEFLFEPLNQCLVSADPLERFQKAVDFLSEKCIEHPINILGCLKHVCHLYPHDTACILKKVAEQDWSHNSVFSPSSINGSIGEVVLSLMTKGEPAIGVEFALQWLGMSFPCSDQDELRTFLKPIRAGLQTLSPWPESVETEFANLVEKGLEHSDALSLLIACLLSLSPGLDFDYKFEGLSKAIDKAMQERGSRWTCRVLQMISQQVDPAPRQPIIALLDLPTLRTFSTNSSLVEALEFELFRPQSVPTIYLAVADYVYRGRVTPPPLTLDVGRLVLDLHEWEVAEADGTRNEKLEEILQLLHSQQGSCLQKALLDLPSDSKLFSSLARILPAFGLEFYASVWKKVGDSELLHLSEIRSIEYRVGQKERDEIAIRYENRFHIKYLLELLKRGDLLTPSLMSRIVQAAGDFIRPGPEATVFLQNARWLYKSDEQLFASLVDIAIQKRIPEHVLFEEIIEIAGVGKLGLHILHQISKRVFTQRAFCRCCTWTMPTVLLQSLAGGERDDESLERFNRQLLDDYLKIDSSHAWNYPDFVSKCLSATLSFNALKALLTQWACTPFHCWRVSILLRVMPWHNSFPDLLASCLDANPKLASDLRDLFDYVHETMPPISRNQFSEIRLQEQLRRSNALTSHENPRVIELGLALTERYARSYSEEKSFVWHQI